MKKIFVMAMIAASMSIPAYAQTLNAVETEEKIIIEASENLSESSIAACFDENGRLIYAGRLEKTENEYTIDKIEDCKKIRIYDLGKGSYDVTVTAPTAAPAVTEAPKPTLHPAYEKEVDAVSAFALVEKAVSSINPDNEEGTELTCLYQGQKITVFLTDETPIKSAPAVFNELVGETAVSLREGDVIYFSTNPSRTKVTGMYLLYRPTNVFEKSSFNSCFNGGLWKVIPYGSSKADGRYTFAFGVVADKYKSGMTLYSHSGLSQDAIDIDFNDNTVTYICDMEGRKPEFEISRASSITSSKIPNSAIDEDDNITYSNDYKYSLAFVRLVDGEATDVVVYRNIKF